MSAWTITRRKLLATCLALAGGRAFALEGAASVPNDTQDWTSPGTAFQSVSDPLYFSPVIDHRRYLLIADPAYEFTEAQWGRLLVSDDMENPALQWTQAAGTLASDATVCLRGARSMKITSPAGAGATGVARKFTQLPADQSASTFPLVIVEAWFKPLDVNLRSVQLLIRPDDTQVRYAAGLRLQLLNGGASVMQIQHLDPTGTFVNDQGYVISLGGGNVGDPWHHLMLGMAYKQGVGGYFNYSFAKVDDATIKYGAGVGAQNIGGPVARQAAVDLVAECDNAGTTVVNWDEVRAGDLSNAFQL